MHIRKTWRATQIWSVFLLKEQKDCQKKHSQKNPPPGSEWANVSQNVFSIEELQFFRWNSACTLWFWCLAWGFTKAYVRLQCFYFDWHMLLTNQETVGRATGACHPHQIGLCVITSSVYEVQQVFQEDTSCAKPPWEIPHNPFFAPPCEQDFEEHWRKPRGLKVKRQARLENIRKKHLCSAQSILVG